MGVFLESSSNYQVTVKLVENKGELVDIDAISACVITQALDKFLPSFSLKLNDSTGEFSHIVPFDKRIVSMDVDLWGAMGSSFSFENWESSPYTVGLGEESIFRTSGLLKVANLFSPNFCRTSTGTIKEFLIQIAEECGAKEIRVSDSLDYPMPIVQPDWSNARLLNYLKKHLVGKNGEGCYFIYFFVRLGHLFFRCEPLSEMLNSPSEKSLAKFYVSEDTQSQSRDNMFPLSEIQIFNNKGVLGSRSVEQSYYDYFESQLVTETKGLEKCPSLSFYHMVGKEDVGSAYLEYQGRNTDYNRDYDGHLQSIFYRRLNSLMSFTGRTVGMINLCPGDIVELLFPRGDILARQHSGYWMVSRNENLLNSGTGLSVMSLIRSGTNTLHDFKPQFVKVGEA